MLALCHAVGENAGAAGRTAILNECVKSAQVNTDHTAAVPSAFLSQGLRAGTAKPLAPCPWPPCRIIPMSSSIIETCTCTRAVTGNAGLREGDMACPLRHP